MTFKPVLAALKSIFIRNGWWKLVSLLLALMIYFSIRSDISHVRVVYFPVEQDRVDTGTGDKEHAVVESIDPPSVRVLLRGPYEEVTQLSESDLLCQIRPRQKKANEDTVAVKVRTSNLKGFNRRLRVVAIEPSQVQVRFDVPMRLEVPVATPVTAGRARGRVQLVYDQTNVVVMGSRRLLSPLENAKFQLQMEPINVEGRAQTFSVRAKLLPPSEVPNAKLDPPDIMVTAKIINENTTATVNQVPVIVMGKSGSAASVWRVEPPAVDIEVSGRSETIAEIKPGDLVVTVNGDIPVVAGNLTNDVPVTVHVRRDLAIDDAKPLIPTVKLIAVEQAEPSPAAK
ncbi:MAG: hypothetical protein IJU44_06965 [Kiritimatiellae bacterium]|nr:hypothetical protein [Kiritimatiellia bacterium]